MLYNNRPCWNKVLAPEMTTEPSPIFPATFGGEKKKPSQERYQPAASTCASPTARKLHSLPQAGNVLHRLQLLAPSEGFVASPPPICAAIAPGI